MVDTIFLTYYQCATLLYKIEELEKANPELDDHLINIFKQDILIRKAEMTYADAIFDTKYDKYPISKAMFNYLVNFTGINPFDKETKEHYRNLIDVRDATEKTDGEVINNKK